MQVGVRKAVASDVDWLVEELREFAKLFESKRSLFEDEAHIRSNLTYVIDNHLVLIAERKDVGSIGFMAGYVTSHPFNPTIRVLQEILWWVTAAHRGSRAGLLLLNEFVNWGRTNVDWVTCAIESKSPISDRVLLSRGFKQIERAYLLEVT